MASSGRAHRHMVPSGHHQNITDKPDRHRRFTEQVTCRKIPAWNNLPHLLNRLLSPNGAVSLSLLPGLILCQQLVWAVDLDVSPSVSGSEHYSDNIYLSPPGETRSGYITQITPEVTVTGKGKRLDMFAHYRMKNIFYDNYNIDNRRQHSLDSSIKSELIEDMLYLDGNASFNQQYISVNGITDPDNLAPSGNTTNVVNYNISPYFLKKLSPTTIANLRYTAGETRYRSKSLSVNDTERQSIQAGLSGDTELSRLKWSLSHQYEKTRTTTGSETTFEKSRAEGQYKVTSQIYLIGQGGYEANKYARLSTGRKTEGSMWGLGVRWIPSPRTSAELVLGERYFGSTSKLTLAHKTRLLNINLSYSEDYTTGSGLVSEAPVFDDSGNPLFLPTLPSISTDTYLDRKLAFSLGASTPRTTLSVASSYIRRESQFSLTDEDIYYVNGIFNRKLGGRTSLILNGYLQLRNPRVLPDESKQAEATLGVSRQTGASTNVSLNYSFLKRVTYNSPVDYERNLLEAVFSMSF